MLYNILLIFVDNLLPIFLAAGVGVLLAWKTSVDPKHLSKILFYVFSPSLMFSLIMESVTPDLPIGEIALVVILTILIVSGVVFLIGKLLKYDKELIIAMMIPALSMNTGNMGLPICLFVFGDLGLTYAGFVLIANVTMTYTFGVAIASMGKQDVKTAIFGLFKLPMIYAVVLGFIFVYTGITPPTPIMRAVDLLSEASIPIMLILLGMNLQKANLKAEIGALSISVAARLILGPIIAYLISPLAGLSGLAQNVTTVQCGMPGAVTSTVLATEYDVKPSFVTAAVTIGTLLSPLTLTPLIWLLTK
jgi:predicted permease